MLRISITTDFQSTEQDRGATSDMRPEFRENVYTAFATVQLASMANSATAMANNLRMPTQLEESRLGYDAKSVVGSRVVYLQYKVSDYLTRTNAKQYGYYTGPYYRFKVKTDVANGYIQHNVLCKLQNTNPTAIVRYCAPAFHTHLELADIFYSSTPWPSSIPSPNKPGVLDKSALISPNILGPVAPDSEHVITYSSVGSKALSFSNPSEGSVESFSDVIEIANSRTKQTTLGNLLQGMVESLGHAILDSFAEEEDFIRSFSRQRAIDDVSTSVAEEEDFIRSSSRRRAIDDISISVASDTDYGRMFRKKKSSISDIMKNREMSNFSKAITLSNMIGVYPLILQ